MDRPLLSRGFYPKPLIVHGVDLRIHLERILNTPRGLKHMPPAVKIIRRSRKQNRIAAAWVRQNRIVFNEMPGYDGFDAIDTLTHEMAHLMAPITSGHDFVWAGIFKRLAREAYGAEIQPDRLHTSHGSRLHAILRDRGAKGELY